MSGWIGFDFDGTLSRLSDGQPIPSMVERVKRFRSQGVEVRICTARINSKMTDEHRVGHTERIERWCLQHIGEVLPVTAEKDYDMALLYDDRAVAVLTDIGDCKTWLEVVEV